VTRFVCEYKFNKRFGTPNHCWTCIGAKGALHLRISGPHVYDNRENWSAGLETHHRQPPEYMADDAPSHEKCWLIGGACWHDGTSLYAEEHYLPMWRIAPHEHEKMFAELEREYRTRFGVETAP